MFRTRWIVLAVCVVLALAGAAFGIQQAVTDGEPSHDERIRDYRQTITASERRIDHARTAIADLELTPSATAQPVR